MVPSGDAVAGLIHDIVCTLPVFPSAGFAELITKGGGMSEVAMGEAVAGEWIGDGGADHGHGEPRKGKQCQWRLA